MTSSVSSSFYLRFTQILEVPDQQERVSQTAALVSEILESGNEINWMEELPLVRACQIGDLKVVNLYLLQGAYGSKQEIRQAVREGIKALKRTDPVQSRAVRNTLKIANRLDELCTKILFEYNSTYGFCGTFQLVCFIAEQVESAAKGAIHYHGKSCTDLSASMILDLRTRDLAYILPKRLDRKKHRISNMIGSGSYKWVFPAMRINWQKRTVQPVVQFVPSHHELSFENNGLKKMEDIARLGKGIPSIHLAHEYPSIKKKGNRQIVLMRNWLRGNLSCHLAAHRKLKGMDPLPLRNQIRIAYWLIRGLRTLHGNGLIHGDIKAVNCLLDERGKAGLIDYDLSDNVGVVPRFWINCFFYGTAPHVPPEQMEKVYMDFGAGMPGDIYALGLILHQLAVGMPEWFQQVITHYNLFEGELDDYGKQINAKTISLDDGVREVKTLFKDLLSRKEILVAQKKLEDLYLYYSNIPEPTLEERFLRLTYSLLRPKPALRSTAEEAYIAVKALYSEIPRWKTPSR